MTCGGHRLPDPEPLSVAQKAICLTLVPLDTYEYDIKTIPTN